MDKNTITGFILIALVMIGFTYFSQPSAEDIARARQQDSIAAVNAEKERELQLREQAILQAKKDSLKSVLDTTSLFASGKQGENSVITLQNELVSINFNTLGGSMVSAKLKDFKNQEQKPVELFTENTSHLNYTWAFKEANLRTDETYFTPEHVTDSTVTMALVGRDGSSIRFE